MKSFLESSRLMKSLLMILCLLHRLLYHLHLFFCSRLGYAWLNELKKQMTRGNRNLAWPAARTIPEQRYQRLQDTTCRSLPQEQTGSTKRSEDLIEDVSPSSALETACQLIRCVHGTGTKYVRNAVQSAGLMHSQMQLGARIFFRKIRPAAGRARRDHWELY